MVNLLSQQARRSLTLTYYARFLSMIFLLAALAVLASAALLVPSYLRAKAEADAAARTLEASQKTVDLGSLGGVSGQFAVLSERLAILKTYSHERMAAPVLAAFSASVPKGVSITKFTLTPAGEGSGILAVSGKAATRSDLLDFAGALQKVPFFAGVSVPVSALASDTNVLFTLSFSFSLSHP